MQSNNIHLPGLGQPTAMFAFDTAEPADARLMNLKPLSGKAIPEQWFAAGPCTASEANGMRIMTSPRYQLHSLVIEANPSQMRALAQDAYQRLLGLVASSERSQLVRFWNYVPQINLGAGDNEVYRQFCWGRAEAFEAHKLALPAATAIGCHDNQLRIAALSTLPETRVVHVENPRQISAYNYPKEYGPRSPSFARATWVEQDQSSLLLLSGTSSIVSHNTLHSGNLEAQVAETKRNVDHLLNSLPQQVGAATKALEAHAMRFYLRDPQQLNLAQNAYQQHFAGYPPAQFFCADICRQDLSMEIEGVFLSSSPS